MQKGLASRGRWCLSLINASRAGQLASSGVLLEIQEGCLSARGYVTGSCWLCWVPAVQSCWALVGLPECWVQQEEDSADIFQVLLQQSWHTGWGEGTPGHSCNLLIHCGVGKAMQPHLMALSCISQDKQRACLSAVRLNVMKNRLTKQVSNPVLSMGGMD